MTASGHVMTYTAGVVGLGRSTSPGWRCPCGWSFRAQPMPRRKTGNNRLEAERAFAAHLDRVALQ